MERGRVVDRGKGSGPGDGEWRGGGERSGYEKEEWRGSGERVVKVKKREGGGRESDDGAYLKQL